MSEFISVPELADFLKQDIDLLDQAAHDAIADASYACQNYTRQHLEEVTDDVIQLEGTWTRELWLPERPVTAVTEIKQGDAVLAASSYSVTRRGKLLWGGTLLLSDQLSEAPWGPYGPEGYWGGPHVLITVKYTHGYPPPLPGDIKLACKRIAGRIFKTPDQSGQLAAEAIGSYTYRTTTPSGGEVSILDGEARLLNRYRRRAYSMSVAP